MKSIVLYSTRTGNTKMVAEAIASALPEGTPCRNIREMNESLSDYDCVFMGFWVDKGTADDASRKVLENLHNRHVAVFATVGVNPASSHAQDCLKNGASLLPEGKKPAGTFICQGKVDPQLIEAMYKRFPADNPHGRTPESEARHKEASTHPDAADLENAAAFARNVMNFIQAEK